MFCVCCTNCDTTASPTHPPTVSSVPSFLPSSHPTQVPTLSVMPSSQPSRLEDALFAILDPVVPDSSLLFVSGTPQEFAFGWLINSEGVLMFSEREIRQRYGLAVLHSTTGGDIWAQGSNWLNPTLSVCRWQWVECQGDIVIALNLGNRGLQGDLPPDMSIFTETGTFALKFTRTIVRTFFRSFFSFRRTSTVRKQQVDQAAR